MAYSQAEAALTNYLDRQVTQKRMSAAAANAQVYALRMGKQLTSLLAELGLESEVVMEWLRAEVKYCEKLAKEKEPQNIES